MVPAAPLLLPDGGHLPHLSNRGRNSARDLPFRSGRESDLAGLIQRTRAESSTRTACNQRCEPRPRHLHSGFGTTGILAARHRPQCHINYTYMPAAPGAVAVDASMARNESACVREKNLPRLKNQAQAECMMMMA